MTVGRTFWAFTSVSSSARHCWSLSPPPPAAADSQDSAHCAHAFNSAMDNGKGRSMCDPSACSCRSRSKSDRSAKRAGMSTASVAQTDNGAPAASRIDVRDVTTSIVLMLLSLRRRGALQVFLDCSKICAAEARDDHAQVPASEAHDSARLVPTIPNFRHERHIVTMSMVAHAKACLNEIAPSPQPQQTSHL